jgi:hypothetical protein
MAGVVTARVGATGIPVENGYTVGFVLLAVGMALAAVAAAFIPDIHTQATGGALRDAENAELSFVPAAPTR